MINSTTVQPTFRGYSWEQGKCSLNRGFPCMDALLKYIYFYCACLGNLLQSLFKAAR